MRSHAKVSVVVIAIVLSSFFALAATPALAVYGIAGKFADTGFGPGGSGSGPGELTGASQIDVNDATGNLYVADTGNNRIQVFKPTATGGEYLDELGLVGPTGLAIDQDSGDVYVATATGISKYTDGLDPAAGWTDPGVTGALAVDPSSGDLLVADAGADLVRRYDSAGSADGSFAAEGPADVAVNSTGDVFVVTAESDLYNYPCTTGSAVERFSAAGVSEGELSLPAPLDAPSSVAVDLDDDSVVASAFATEYFCERGNLPQVAVFDEDGSFREASPLDPPAMYAAVPGLTAQAGGSNRVYTLTRSPLNDVYGNTAIYLLEDLTPPAVTVAPADEVGPFAARLSGTVHPEGSATTCRFEYGTLEIALDSSVPCASNPGSGTSPVAVEAKIQGLSTDTTYYFRLRAANNNGAIVATSPIESFTTAHADPAAVTIDPPAAVTGTSAQLSGTIDPLGNPASYRFEYRISGAPEWKAAAGGSGSAGSGTGPVSKSVQLQGLQPSTTYEARLSATNGTGTATSAPEEFTTLPSAPLVQTLSAGQVEQSGAILRASIDPAGEPTTYYFEYGLDTGYGTRVPAGEDGDAGSGNGAELYSARIGGLLPGTVYHYRVVAENGTGVAEGNDSSFMTATTPAGCPNESQRERQGSQFLPDCRAYEMVSPPQKNGYDVSGKEHSQYGIDFTPQSSPSGNAAAFTTHGTFSGAKSNTTFTTFRALRGADGWSTEALTPYVNYQVAAIPFYRFSDDFRSWFIEGPLRPQLTPEATEETANGYFFDGAAGAYRLTTPGLEKMTSGSALIDFGDWSANQEKVFFSVYNGNPLTGEGEAAPELERLYEWDRSSGALKLVGKEPGTNSPFPGSVEIANPDTEQTGRPATTAGWNAVSADGSKVFFYAPVKPNQQLYVRVNGASTQHVSASRRSEPDPNGDKPATYHWASADGETAFFSSAEKLTDDATTGPDSLGSDLYRYEVSSEELTDITVDPLGANGAEVQGVLGGSEDGTRLYFVARGELAPGAVGGADNLYLWTDDGTPKGQIEFVSSGVGEENWYRLSYLDPRRTGRVAPDGMHVLFMSRDRLSDYDNAGHFEVYVYDAAAGSVSCASCNPSGVPAGADAMALGVGDSTTVSRTLSDDGRFAFFGTTEGLVPTDVNSRLDVYRYDSEANRIDLISPGTGAFPAEFQDASADGRDVMFTTRQQLLTSDFDTNVDVYDARAGGGFLSQSPPPPPVPCFGEACRSEPVVPPLPAGAASADVHGKGNVSNQKAKKPNKKQKKCKGKAKRGKKCKAGKGKPNKSKEGRR